MTKEEKIQSILDQAVKEEKEYNWIAAANLYEDILNLMVPDDDISKKGEIYKRLGYSSSRSANQAEFGGSFIYTPEKDRTERTIPSQQEGLIYKDVDLFKLRSERKKWEKEQLKERAFIQSTRT